MALVLYHDSGLTQPVSGSSPITTEHPLSGSAVEVQVYLANDNSAKYYTGISITPTDTTNTNASTNWIQLAPDSSGVAGTYGSAAAALSMSDVGASGSADTTAHPFWVKVTTPSEADTINISEISLTVAGKEYAV